MTLRFQDFCQFFEGLGFGFEKSPFFGKFVLEKVLIAENLASKKVPVSENFVSETNEAEWQEKDKIKRKV